MKGEVSPQEKTFHIDTKLMTWNFATKRVMKRVLKRFTENVRICAGDEKKLVEMLHHFSHLFSCHSVSTDKLPGRKLLIRKDLFSQINVSTMICNQLLYYLFLPLLRQYNVNMHFLLLNILMQRLLFPEEGKVCVLLFEIKFKYCV